ncbi:MAG: hypothetical protein LBV76_05305 [Deltaproteobacteria bacterium]|nr:hypothetical protein [Deltaproteobacteria bacterium]
MKKVICLSVIMFALFIPLVSHAAEAAQDVQTGVKDATNELLSIMGDVVSGMSGGMQEGARKMQEQLDGADGVRLVSNKDDLANLLQLSVLQLEHPGDGKYKVTLAVRNTNEFPVRLVNLRHAQAIMLLDAEGFAYALKNPAEQGANITVPSRAAVRASYTFEGVQAAPAFVRLHDTDFMINSPVTLRIE